MKRHIGKAMVAITIFAVALASMVSSAYGQQCSLAVAAGKYSFSDSGTVVDVGPRAAVGLLTFDASGKIHGLVIANLNGSVTQATLSGTYTVNSECRGTASFSELDESKNLILTASVAIVWDNNMQEARFIFTSIVLADGTPLSTVVNGDAKKLVP